MKAPDCAARYVHDRAGSAASPGESCLLRGCAELYGITGEKVFRDYILQRCEAFAEDAKEILGFPECASGLFFALDQTGDARFREAIERCRGLCSAAGAAPDRFDVMLPFYAAYEMRFGGKREIGNVAGIFSRFRETLYDEQKGLYAPCPGEPVPLLFQARLLAALIDCAKTVDEQLFEHRRRLTDLFREGMAGLIPLCGGETGVYDETAGDRSGNKPDLAVTSLFSYAALKGVRLGVLSAEKTLPRGTAAFRGAAEIAADALPADDPRAAGAFMMALAESLRAGKGA